LELIGFPILLANAQDKNKNKIFVKNIKTKILGTLNRGEVSDNRDM
jgi:hypothetical protein